MPHSLADDFPPGRWRARFIWTALPPTQLAGGTGQVRIEGSAARSWALFRRSVVLDEVPASVPARMTADSRYALWVNGTEVSRGPIRANPLSLHHDRVDLAPFLVPGRNVLAVLARHHGLPTPWWMPAVPTFGLGGGSFVFEAHLGAEWLVSDGTWRALDTGAWTEVEATGVSAAIPEVVDARKLPAGWTAAAFDDTSWASAVELVTYHVGFPGHHHPPVHPYGSLPVNPLPPLQGEVREPVVISTAIVPPPPADEGGFGGGADAAFGAGAVTEDDPVAQQRADEAAAEPQVVLETPAPLPFTLDPGAGVAAVAVLDFGEEVAGLLEIEVDAPDGTRLDIRAAEAISGAGVLETLGQTSGASYTARGHDDRYTTIERIGLRYAGISVRGGPVTVRRLDIRERLRARPGHEAAGPTFECSDPALDAIWQIGRRTVDLCAQDAYLDCPSREQRAWTGDAVVHQLVDLATNPDWSLAARNVALGASPRPDGMLPMATAGDIEHSGSAFIPDWALHWVEAVWNLWRYTGDAALVDPLLPVAERVLRWFEPYAGADGLLVDVTGWLIIDWSAVHTTGVSGALNALWARALRRFAEVCEDRDRAGAAAWARMRYVAVAEGFESLWDEDRGVYVDHALDGVAQRPVSQHTNAAAIAAGLVPADRQAALIGRICDPERLEYAAWLVPGRRAHLDSLGPDDAGDMYKGVAYLITGPPEPWWDVEEKVVAAQPFFRYVVHQAVAEAGLADRLPALCRDWDVLVERGAGRTWSEVWYGGSHCHGWSSTPTADLTRHVLGITPATPGFATARVAPRLGDLEWVRGSAPTPHGLVSVDVDADRVRIESPVPIVASLSGGADDVALEAGQHEIPRR